MKVLVTGASGFVGSQFVKYLAAKEGYDVRAMVRKSSRTDELKDLNIEICTADVTDPDTLPSALEGVDAVVHLVSIVGEEGDRSAFYRVNVEGTRNLLEACRNLPLKRFVHISSLSVITGYKDHTGTTEDAPYEPTGEHYADTKIEGEKLALMYHRKYGIPVTVLRPGFIFGPGDRLFLPTVIENLRNGKVILIGRGKKYLNLTHIDNLNEAIELALTHDNAVGEVFNITDGEKVTKAHFFQTIADLIGVPRPQKSIPFPVAKSLCSALSAIYSTLHIKKPPPLTRMKLRFAGQNQYFDISKAESMLGYQHKVHFDDGVQNAVKWYNQHVA